MVGERITLRERVGHDLPELRRVVGSGGDGSEYGFPYGASSRSSTTPVRFPDAALMSQPIAPQCVTEIFALIAEPEASRTGTPAAVTVVTDHVSVRDGTVMRLPHPA